MPGTPRRDKQRSNERLRWLLENTTAVRNHFTKNCIKGIDEASLSDCILSMYRNGSIEATLADAQMDAARICRRIKHEFRRSGSTNEATGGPASTIQMREEAARVKTLFIGDVAGRADLMEEAPSHSTILEDAVANINAFRGSKRRADEMVTGLFGSVQDKAGRRKLKKLKGLLSKMESAVDGTAPAVHTLERFV